MNIKPKKRAQKRSGIAFMARTGGKPKEPEYERAFKLESVTLAKMKAMGI